MFRNAIDSTLHKKGADLGSRNLRIGVEKGQVKGFALWNVVFIWFSIIVIYS